MATAIECFKAASDQGSADGQVRWAAAYIAGIGTEKNTELAIQLLNAARKQSHPMASLLLKMIEKGQTPDLIQIV